MPTFALTERFKQDWANLTPDQQADFRAAVAHFVDDMKANHGFRKGLRVKRIRRTKDIWEMTWADNGRATWQYGSEIKLGEAHVIWRRIGTHDIFGSP